MVVEGVEVEVEGERRNRLWRASDDVEE